MWLKARGTCRGESRLDEEAQEAYSTSVFDIRDRVAQSVEQRTSEAMSVASEPRAGRDGTATSECRSMLGRPESPSTTTRPATADVKVLKAGGLGNQQARGLVDHWPPAPETRRGTPAMAKR
jgi:hypothetical protein